MPGLNDTSSYLVMTSGETHAQGSLTCDRVFGAQMILVEITPPPPRSLRLCFQLLVVFVCVWEGCVCVCVCAHIGLEFIHYMQMCKKERKEGRREIREEGRRREGGRCMAFLKINLFLYVFFLFIEV